MKMPVLFVGHGSPMNAIERNAFTRSLRELGKRLPAPKAISVVSAHWVTRGCQVLGADWPRTIHDFYGFPRPLSSVSRAGSPGRGQAAGHGAALAGRSPVGFRSWGVERFAAPVS